LDADRGCSLPRWRPLPSYIRDEERGEETEAMRNVIKMCVGIDEGDIRRVYILDEQRKEGRKEGRKDGTDQLGRSLYAWNKC